MLEFLSSLPPFVLALILGLLCALCTSLGALSAFFCHGQKPRQVAVMLSFAGGIMLASSFFSLILPALEYCGEVVWKEIVFVVLGFLLGALFVSLTNMVFDKKFSLTENFCTTKRKSMLVATSITLHNIPEGMSVGVLAASATALGEPAAVMAAVWLAISIGIQNIPEGASVALALRSQGQSKKRAFFVGLASGLVEPVFACIALVLSTLVLGVLPMLLAFSAGAMVMVAITELLPEALEKHKLLAATLFAAGFGIMALFDVVL